MAETEQTAAKFLFPAAARHLQDTDTECTLYTYSGFINPTYSMRLRTPPKTWPGHALRSAVNSV